METLIQDSGIAFTPDDLNLAQLAFDEACRGFEINDSQRRDAALAILEAFRRGARNMSLLKEIGRSALFVRAA